MGMRPKSAAGAPGKRGEQLDMLCEVLKLLRSQALNRLQIQAATGYAAGTVRSYTLALEAHGFLRSYLYKADDENGLAPRVYIVAPAWGGPTEAGP